MIFDRRFDSLHEIQRVNSDARSVRLELGKRIAIQLFAEKHLCELE